MNNHPKPNPSTTRRRIPTKHTAARIRPPRTAGFVPWPSRAPKPTRRRSNAERSRLKAKNNAAGDTPPTRNRPTRLMQHTARPKPGSTRASSTAHGSLQATGLRKTYGKRTVVQDVSLSVESGEVVGLLGPNGAGKTTSSYMILGLVHTDS